jgi:hypothetical protein
LCLGVGQVRLPCTPEPPRILLNAGWPDITRGREHALGITAETTTTHSINLYIFVGFGTSILNLGEIDTLLTLCLLAGELLMANSNAKPLVSFGDHLWKKVCRIIIKRTLLRKFLLARKDFM